MRKIVFSRLFFITLLIYSVVSITSTNLAMATPSGCTSSTTWEHHYIGGLKSSVAAWGVQGNIETQTMDFCPSSGYSLWVSNASSTSNAWVQMGYRKNDGYSSNYVYTEANDDPNNYYVIKDWNAPSGTNTYTVDFVWTGNDLTYYWDYRLNGVSKWSVSFDDVNFTPYQVQVVNELHDSGNQTGGTLSNPVSWGYIQVKTSKTGTSYSSISLDKYLSSTITSHSGTNMTNPDNAWEIWDTRY